MSGEIVLAMMSGVVLLLLVVLVAMYVMKVKFVLKAVVWVRKLTGTSLKEQAAETCEDSDFSKYADDDDELWDIIVDDTKCPGKTTDDTNNSTSTSTGEMTSVQKVNIITSNCSAYKSDFIQGNPSIWTQNRLDQWIKFQSGSCTSIDSYEFSSAEKSWLTTSLITKCPNLTSLAGMDGKTLYSIWASSNPTCQVPTGVPVSTGPDNKTFYHPTTLSQSIHFGLRPSLTGSGTITFGHGGSISTATYTYNESSNMITFTGVPVGSYLAGVTPTYRNSTLTISGTAWLNTNPFLTAGFKERVFTNPNLQDGVTERVKILSETTLQWTKGTQVSNVRIFILMYQNTGIINKDSNDSSAFPYTGITFSAPNLTQEVTELIFGRNTIWSSVNPRDIRNIIGTSKTYYRSDSNQGITFTSASLNSATFVNVPGITTPVSYTTEYEPSSLRWKITFGTAFLDLGSNGYLSESGFIMGTNTFSENQGQPVEQRYTIREGLRNITGYSISDVVNAGDNIESNFWIGFKVPGQNKLLNMLDSSPTSIMTVWDKQDNDFRDNQRFIITGDGKMINRRKGGIAPETGNPGTRLHSMIGISKFDYDWSTKQLKFTYQNTDGWGHQNTYCVTRTGLRDGDPVTLQICDNNNNNQKWEVIPVRNRLHIVGDEGKYMHVDNGEASTDNKSVIAWGSPWNGNADFQFDPRTGQIKFRDSPSHCLTTSFIPTANETRTVIQPCNVTDAKMKWVYDGLADDRPANTALGGETQNFINIYSGQCLTFKEDGKELITTQCNPTNQNQKWQLK